MKKSVAASLPYGETYQQVTEYYLTDGNLLFVLDTTFKYNRPMYYDSTAMTEANDTETFDFNKSAVIVDSVYFPEGKIIHRATLQQGSPQPIPIISVATKRSCCRKRRSLCA